MSVENGFGQGIGDWAPGMTVTINARAEVLEQVGADCSNFSETSTWDVQLTYSTCGSVPSLGSGTVTVAGDATEQLLKAEFTLPKVCPAGSAFHAGEPIGDSNPSFVTLSMQPPSGEVADMESFRVYSGGASQPMPPGLLPGGQAPTGLQADPVASLTGAFQHAVVDSELPVRGGSLDVWRSYNSDIPAGAGMGPGWTHSFSDSLDVVQGQQATWHTSHGGSVVFKASLFSGWRPPVANTSRLTKNSDGTFAVGTEDRWTLKFTSTGDLMSMTDRNGRVISINRDPQGRVATVSNAGRTLTYHYTTGGQVASVSSQGGSSQETTTYEYTGGLLTKATRPGGVATVYGYDAQGRLSSIRNTSASSPQLSISYGPDGRVTSQTDGMGNTATWQWDAASKTSTMTDARGGEWTDVYENGWLVRQSDPTGVTTHYDWTDEGWLFRVTNTTGDGTAFLRDSSGHVIGRIDPTGRVERITFDFDQKEPRSATDFIGRTTTYAYDSRRNLTRVTPPETGASSGVTYAPSTFDPATFTDATQHASSFTWSAQGDLRSVVSPLGNEESFLTDDLGQLTSVTPPAGNASGATGQWATTISRDAGGRVADVTSPSGAVQSFAYDSFGRVASMTNARQKTTSYSYDNAGRLASVTRPDSVVPAAVYSYDENGNRITSVDAEGRTTTFGYDAANRLSSVEKGNREWSFTYDENGRRDSITAPSGRTTSLSWNSRSLLTAVNYSDTTPDVTYTYDGAGRRTSMTDGLGTTSYTYDDLDRPTEIVRNSESWLYEWDGVGHLQSRTAPGQTAVDYDYDADGRLVSVSRGGTTLAAYAYDAAANSMTRTQSNGVKTVQEFDRDGNLAQQVSTDGSGAVLERQTIHRDEMGNPTRVVDGNNVSTAYQYDNLNRLSQVCYAASDCTNASDFIRYEYDRNGNLTEEVRPAGAVTYAYDALDQLTNRSGPAGTTTYTYDDDGNRLSDGDTTYVVNAAGQITASTTGATTTNYDYSGSGQLVRKTTDGSTTDIDYDPVSAQLVGERPQGQAARAFVYGRELLNLVEGNSLTFYGTDELGSVTTTRDSAGAAQRTFAYEPYGAVKGQSAIPGAVDTPLTFHGGYGTPSGNLRFGFREYAPGTAGFTTPDQAGTGDPYGFAGANPIIATDPLGLYSWDNFLQDVNQISGYVATGAGFVALGCSAAVVCAPVVPLAGAVAGVGTAVNVTSGAAVAARSCTDAKGSCAEGVILAGVSLLGSKFGAGRLMSRAAADNADEAADIGHAALRHQFPNTLARRSQFFDDIDLGALSSRTKGMDGFLQPNGNTRYVLQHPGGVGVDRTTGVPTDVFTVIRRPDGSVVTMFPGTSPMG